MNKKTIGALVVVLCAIAAIALCAKYRRDPPPIASRSQLVPGPHREPPALATRPQAAPELAAPAARSEALARTQSDRIAALGKMIAAPLHARWESEPKNPKWSELEKPFETGGGIPVLDGQRMTMYLAAPGQSVFGATLLAALRAGLGGRTPS